MSLQVYKETETHNQRYTGHKQKAFLQQVLFLWWEYADDFSNVQFDKN